MFGLYVQLSVHLIRKAVQSIPKTCQISFYEIMLYESLTQSVTIHNMEYLPVFINIMDINGY